jgi:hypothetical protein
MKTINELITFYQKELQDLLAIHRVNEIRFIANVRDRTEAMAIRRFLLNLKNLPNEPKTVSNNECKKKVCDSKKITIDYKDKYLKMCKKLGCAP